MGKKVVITGGCGFIGHHLIEHFIKNTNWDIIVIDRLSYASNGFDRLRDINIFDDKRIKVFTVGLQNPVSTGIRKEIGQVDYIVNLASESHVDNSIKEPVRFILNNVKLVLNMLEWAREMKPKKFIQFSTDEVAGVAPEEVNHKEDAPHNPSNPYSSSKAAQEDICRAYANTYQLPIVITRTMNVIGERQHPEKFVPMVIKRVLNGGKVFIHANKDKTKAGSRFYIHARNVAQAVYFILENTNEYLNKNNIKSGVFNIVGEKEIDNLSLAKFIAEVIGRPLKYELVDFHSSRPGHDLRYALDGTKLKSYGFEYPKTFEESLTKTIKWYLTNTKWL